MLDTNNKLTQEEKIDTEELVRDFKRLPEREREKIYYMIKGAHLLRENDLSEAEKKSRGTGQAS